MSTLLEYFDATYMINRPERTDRLRSVRQQLAHVGWSVGPGGVEVFPACTFADRAGFPNAGARGCFHSHLECLRRAQLAQCRNILMLEDDVAFASALPRLAASVVSQLNRTAWDFVYFGHEETGDIPRADLRTQPSDVHFETTLQTIHTTHFYAINGRVLPRIITHLERLSNGIEGDQVSGPMPIDGAFHLFRLKNPDVRCFITVPKLGWQRPSRSDIIPRRFDSLTVVRPIISVLRELKYLTTSWSR
jgi:glycosyl transferase family 25